MGFQQDYARNKGRAAEFEGFFGDASIGIMTSMLAAQEERGVTGDILECGVYKGRSASVLLSHLRDDEHAYLVDLHRAPNEDALRAINPNCSFIYGRSEELATDRDFGTTVGDNIRFSHHDASHTYENLTSELKFISKRLAPGGIVALDDFMNPNYLQVVVACFDFIRSRNVDLEIVLYSSAKAYLCRSADFDFYARHIRYNTLHALQSVGHHFYLSRTDDHEKYRAFSLVPKKTPDQSDFYGQQFNGDKYYNI